MRTTELALPVLAAIAVTRGMLGIGVGLLLSARIPRRKRERVGWTLVAIGAASTVPLAAVVFGRS